MSQYREAPPHNHLLVPGPPSLPVPCSPHARPSGWSAHAAFPRRETEVELQMEMEMET
eukprot:CAMPEP_0183363288 /NCGR_PEP_ID=MMETSP0164_2-20130417/74403_1 /TAXON_ID=221442 /ORGANISM="Coccolithus pelagicus ssp braarudi, Strain PLY182g" /LENGTH=57 /DNA_ID=CAMNT_0025538357 /DNA_START=227 /DNA_END=397 /DNA_ORIENTATION=+